MKRLPAVILAVLAAAAILVAVSILAQSTLTVIYPNGGGALYKGLTYKLQWQDGRGTPPVNVDISVYDGNTSPPHFCFLARTTTINDGEYWWTVPCIEEWSNNCYFRVEDTPEYPGQPHSDESDDGFWIKYQGDDP